MPVIRATAIAFAALLIGVLAARAEDQLITDEPADPNVRICEAYGPGYQLVPGTTTCIKIQGMVRMDMQVTPGGQTQTPPAASGDK